MVKNGETLLMNGYFTVINGDFMWISLIETIVSNGK
jgi:hypothetical protein